MTAKSQPRLAPSLLRHRQYSGTISTLLYNWPLFAGALAFGVVALVAGSFLFDPWRWLLVGAGLLVLALPINVLVTSFVVYDWGQKHEYDRLVELAQLSRVNVIIDITCGKLRGTRGLLSRVEQGHYFLIDIYDPQKMTDPALRRARAVEPSLLVERRIYRRTGTPQSLPIPHNWADVIYCNFSLHELHNSRDRQAIFNEFARILKPDGKLLLAEHGRSWLNFVGFGLGAFSFLPAKCWNRHIAKSGMVIQHFERWRGVVNLWVVGRQH